MNLVCLLPLAGSIVVLSLGLNGYYLNPRSRLNRVFLILFILLSMEMFIIYGYLQSQTISQAEFFWRIDLVWPFIVPALLFFVITYLKIGNGWKTAGIIAVLFTISISFFVIELTTDWITGPPKEYMGGYYFSIGDGNAVVLVNSIITNVLVLISLVLVILNFIRSGDGKERKSSSMVMLGLFIPCSIGLIFDLITPMFGIKMPLTFTISLIIGAVFIWNGLRIRHHYNISLSRAAPDVLDSIPDGIIITSRIGKLVAQNKGSKLLLKYSKPDLEHMDTWDLFPEDSSIYSKIRPSAGGIGFQRWDPSDLEVRVLTAEGHELPVSLTKVSIRDRKGRVQGYALILRDQTFMKIFEDQVNLRRSKLEEDIMKRARELEASNLKLNRAVRELRATRSRSENEKRKAELYLDIMTHDISNLHQGVQAWLSMAGLNIEDPDRVSGFIKKARESVDRSIWLVKNIILISDLRKTKPKLYPVEVMTAVKRSIDKVRSQFNEKDVIINVHNPYSRLMIEADDQIEEVFFHVLHNGLKFSKNGSPKVDVTLTVENGGHDLTISFLDHGRGIPNGKKEDVFNRLESKEKYSHTGLGLALVKTLMARYKGIVWITDRVHGDHTKGAVFHLRFKLFEYG